MYSKKIELKINNILHDFVTSNVFDFIRVIIMNVFDFE